MWLLTEDAFSMFVKPFRTKSAVTVRNSDRRKLKSRLATFFPGTPEESLAHMVPAKGDFKETKVITHKGEPVSVFTAYGLWKDSFFHDLRVMERFIFTFYGS